ncbi:MAG TPA: phosphatase PAP2 family protein [Thermomonas sp.]|nr:phosphatase PAP2 family protein [Thermomonas sp.]
MSHTTQVLFAVAATGLLGLGACASSPTSTSADAQAPVPERAPGVLVGYLQDAERADSLAMLPPPPTPGSAAFANDEAVRAAAAKLKGSPRWELAAVDAELIKPSMLQTFSCALGVPVNQTDTPNLARLLRRTLSDGSLSTRGAKVHYQRVRPFVAHNEGTCLPHDEESLRKNGSYPSGHTAIGWTQALVLAQVSPANADALFARGLAYGESRVVCNAHWQSDIIEGKVMAAATFALLQNNAAYRQDVSLATADVAKAKAKGLKPSKDCAAEAAALAMRIPGIL